MRDGYGLTINGKSVRVGQDADLTRRLIDVLRVDYGLTGTKEGCAEGECGACLVFMDGKLYNSCLVPLANAIDKRILTIEGLRETRIYPPIARAFHEAGAVQCGFCTPGMVMATAALLFERKWHELTLEEIKEGLCGNLCRCTGYQTIFEAVQVLAAGEETIFDREEVDGFSGKT